MLGPTKALSSESRRKNSVNPIEPVPAWLDYLFWVGFTTIVELPRDSRNQQNPRRMAKVASTTAVPGAAQRLGLVLGRSPSAIPSIGCAIESGSACILVGWCLAV